MNKKNEPLKITYMRALENYKKKNYKNAEDYCYKILSIDSYHFDSILMLSRIAAINKNLDQVKELLIKAVEIQPKNTTAIHNLGTCYKELGQLEEAKNYYNKALEIDPRHTNSNYNLGVISYQLKDLKKTKSYLKKTIDLQKNYGLAFFSLGNVHADLREYNDALSCYQKAIEINPRIVGAHNNLGLVYRTLNDLENAVKSYQNVLKIQPKHVGVFHNLALAYKELGKFDQSIEYNGIKNLVAPVETLVHKYLSQSELGLPINIEHLKALIEGFEKNNQSWYENEPEHINWALYELFGDEKYIIEAKNKIDSNLKNIKHELHVKYLSYPFQKKIMESFNRMKNI